MIGRSDFASAQCESIIAAYKATFFDEVVSRSTIPEHSYRSALPTESVVTLERHVATDLCAAVAFAVALGSSDRAAVNARIGATQRLLLARWVFMVCHESTQADSTTATRNLCKWERSGMDWGSLQAACE